MNRTTRTADSWQIMLPPGWVTVPTDPEKSRAAVHAVGARLVRDKHRDELVKARIEVEQTLMAQVEQARKQGAAAVHSLVEPIRGVPVSASLVVTELTLPTDEEMKSGLAQVFGNAVGVLENEQVEIAGLHGLRRRRRAPMELPEGTPADMEAWETHLDYVLATGPDDYLLLNYATVTDPIADELVVLFDAITSTLHRTETPTPSG
ncbi:hypothetical protein IEQ44_06150 [Nocardioides sp. Y6]|uniref:Uncharacterized protein n=1 Tax=Nocardioides malaquae TaxID=2773426 RepID=A0ABR9RRR1_9ACTN|nr:hypothetical protein [Nocardioides malaquae]MBE7324228.1 hypothetical protein [Nocardioides malaquae]